MMNEQVFITLERALAAAEAMHIKIGYHIMAAEMENIWERQGYPSLESYCAAEYGYSSDEVREAIELAEQDMEACRLD